MTDLPTVLSAAGLQPQQPAVIQSALISLVAATNAGYTANLPLSIVEDVSSTEVGGIVLIDNIRVDTVNSMTPFGANVFLLVQLANVYGVNLNASTNTSVDVVFTGTPGFVVAKGFIVSDGTYQYITQEGVIIGSGDPTLGVSPTVAAVAVLSGSWAVPSGTVQGLITSVPSDVTLSVNNPNAGTPATSAPTEMQARTQVFTAGLAASQGMTRYMKTLLANVPGVQQRLISVLQAPNNGGWEVLVGGGDPYQVGNAIFSALFDINTLVGSQLAVSGITNANPGVVTTNLNHNFTTGQSITMADIGGMIELNSTPLTVTVLTPTTFSVGVNTTSFPAYTTGGIFVPNPRNITVSINDYPNVYAVIFVNPPQQTVAVTLTWNTTLPNFVSQAAVAQAGQPAIIAYINGITVGQPINLFAMEQAFLAAVANIIPPAFVTTMSWAVSINGVGQSPEAGTGIIPGDIESYFQTSAASVSIQQG